jgi:hypothetical protein
MIAHRPCLQIMRPSSVRSSGEMIESSTTSVPAREYGELSAFPGSHDACGLRKLPNYDDDLLDALALPVAEVSDTSVQIRAILHMFPESNPNSRI